MFLIPTQIVSQPKLVCNVRHDHTLYRVRQHEYPAVKKSVGVGHTKYGIHTGQHKRTVALVLYATRVVLGHV